CDISETRTWEALPAAARAYVERIENAVGCHIRYVSVGAERNAFIER
ncbi:MAG: adenylosuccinate synthetase, partial [Oscillospiraceae bacterium]|nr:adenylosuccinate synthetase [Oscillospiraceae bacterium]